MKCPSCGTDSKDSNATVFANEGKNSSGTIYRCSVCESTFTYGLMAGTRVLDASSEAAVQKTTVPEIDSGAEIDYEALGEPTDLGRISALAYVLLGLSLLAAVGAVVQAMNQLGLVSDLTSLDQLTVEQASDYDRMTDTATSLQLTAVILGGIGFISFFVVSYRNAMKIGARAFRYGWGWSLGSWFTPIWNLFRPKQVADDLWKSSTAFDPDSPTSWRNAPVANRVHFWWALWILGLIAARVDTVYYDSLSPASGIAGFTNSSTISLVSFSIDVVGIILALTIVNSVVTGQRRALRQLAPSVKKRKPSLPQNPVPVVEHVPHEGANATPDGRPKGNDELSKIAKLGDLRDSGLISDEEFEAKKTELLKRL